MHSKTLLWTASTRERSEHKTTHLSDALRYALVYKQGGFYSDLDTVTIRSTINIAIFW